jgi:diguanylate cyclase (GGDEF)-like protein
MSTVCDICRSNELKGQISALEDLIDVARVSISTIDDFKKINDQYGHPMGDCILSSIGATITRILRSVDFSFRYGGEEFAVLLPETKLKSARGVAERIRKKVIDNCRTLLRISEKEPVTVSTGIACYPGNATTPEALFAAADSLLYKAKDSGKNCILSNEGDRL